MYWRWPVSFGQSLVVTTQVAFHDLQDCHMQGPACWMGAARRETRRETRAARGTLVLGAMLESIRLQPLLNFWTDLRNCPLQLRKSLIAWASAWFACMKAAAGWASIPQISPYRFVVKLCIHSILLICTCRGPCHVASGTATLVAGGATCFLRQLGSMHRTCNRFAIDWLALANPGVSGSCRA